MQLGDELAADLNQFGGVGPLNESLNRFPPVRPNLLHIASVGHSPCTRLCLSVNFVILPGVSLISIALEMLNDATVSDCAKIGRIPGQYSS